MIGFIRNKSLPARRYLVLLVLPWCLMLLLTVAVLWPYLAGFRTTVKTLQDVRLPGILEAQRTRTNLNMLRKQLAIIYLAEAPLERRRARLHAQALLAGMAHDPSPVATEVLALGPRIRQLYVICMEADKGLSRLHRHEMEMMLALNSLEQATGRKMAGEVIFSHTGRDGVRHGRMAFEKMQRLMAPVEQMCAGSEEFRDICDLFGKHKRALGEAWREKLAIDAQARALWQSLEDELLRLVNEVSSRELQRSLEGAESLSEATDYINDTLGHQEGDACLHRVAQAMRDGLRGGDREIFRYGGEEFAVVLDEVSPEHALHVAERLRQTVEQLGIPHPGSPAGHVTISLGVAAVEVLTPETLPRLLETADSALYSAKEHGRNRVHLAGELVKKSACLAAGDRL